MKIAILHTLQTHFVIFDVEKSLAAKKCRQFPIRTSSINIFVNLFKCLLESFLGSWTNCRMKEHMKSPLKKIGNIHDMCVCVGVRRRC